MFVQWWAFGEPISCEFAKFQTAFETFETDMEFGQVVLNEDPVQPSQAPTLAVESSEALAILSTGLDTINTNLSAMQRRIEKVEQEQEQRFDLNSFMMGMGIAVVFMVLIALIVVSWVSGRNARRYTVEIFTR